MSTKTDLIDVAEGASRLLDTPTSALIAASSDTNAIALWSDAKKTDFLKTFHDRAAVARFLLRYTAGKVFAAAMRRKFISEKHAAALDRRCGTNIVGRLRHGDTAILFLELGMIQGYDRYDVKDRNREVVVGGRSFPELDRIAEERSQLILNELPPVKQAVQIIAPDVAKMIDRRDSLLVKGQVTTDALNEVSTAIKLSEVDETMTVKALHQMIRARDLRRRSLLQELRDIGTEGSDLEETISKRLFAGLPGRSEALLDVVSTHLERAPALEATERRVDEQVKFGDSEAALEILRHFEKDEVEVSASIKATFATALAALKASVKGMRSTGKPKPPVEPKGRRAR